MELATEVHPDCCLPHNEGLEGWHTGLTLLDDQTNEMHLMHYNFPHLVIQPIATVINSRKGVHINDCYLRMKNNDELQHVQVDQAALFYTS